MTTTRIKGNDNDDETTKEERGRRSWKKKE